MLKDTLQGRWNFGNDSLSKSSLLGYHHSWSPTTFKLHIAPVGMIHFPNQASLAITIPGHLLPPSYTWPRK